MKLRDYKEYTLVIYKDAEGNFIRYQWIPPQSARNVDAVIGCFNNNPNNKGKTVEVITDPLVRAICAHREKCRSFEALLDAIELATGEMGDTIGAAHNFLADVESLIKEAKDGEEVRRG